MVISYTYHNNFFFVGLNKVKSHLSFDQILQNLWGKYFKLDYFICFDE